MHFYRKDSTLESSSCFKWYNSFEFDTNQGNKYFLHLCYREQFKQMHWNSWLTLDYRQYQLKIQGCSVTDVLWGFMHTGSSMRGKGTAKPHNFFPKKLKIHSFSAQLHWCLFIRKILSTYYRFLFVFISHTEHRVKVIFQL